jgi:hypothetical protein
LKSVHAPKWSRLTFAALSCQVHTLEVHQAVRTTTPTGDTRIELSVQDFNNEMLGCLEAPMRVSPL